MRIEVQTHDSALGQWTAGRWIPPASSALCGLVERIWYFDGKMTHQRERVFPDGSAQVIVMLDEPHRDGDAHSLPSFPAVCVNGLRTRPSVVVSPLGRCRVVGITFTPLGAAALLRSVVSDLVDITIDLRDAMGRLAEELGERCAGAAESSAWNASRNAAATLTAAAAWVLDRVDADRAPEESVRAATCFIRDSRGAVSVERIASTLGIPRSQLARRFQEYTGVTPKHYARIIRFNAALREMTRGGSIASVAADLGYYDQAHMYRDFEDFASMTPGEFLTGNRYPGSASLAE